MQDYYKNLNIDQHATQDEIKKAYRALAMKWHPDRNQDEPNAKEEFQKISEAYECLSDPEKRRRYDSPQPSGFNPFGGGQGGFEDMLRDIFANQGGVPPGFNWSSASATPKNRDIQYNLQVTLEDVFHGKKLPLNVNFNNIDRHIEVEIPVGADSGHRIKFPGQGDESIPEVAAGDLYIQLIVQQHARFKRQGQSLGLEINIDAIRACVGTKQAVLNIDNVPVEIVIPAGTQHGTHIAIKNQGMKNHNSTHRGDLIVIVNVVIPTNLDDQQKSLLEQFISYSKGRI